MLLSRHTNRAGQRRLRQAGSRYGGLTRNRSIDPYRANKGVLKDINKCHAINPNLFMTRIDCLDSTGQFKPIGAFSSFSVHPNAVPYGLFSNGLYNGEVFAYMEREVEWAIRERYKPQGEAVHSAVNGTQADNSSDYQPGKQWFIEAKRIGTAIERKAVELFISLDGKLTDDAAVQSIVRERDVYENPCIDGVCLCERPVVGNTLTTRGEDS